ncbi:glycoside hydrolase family 25 protein [Ethanoligenens sp.]|uniref:glycoside hydrolase family 25 protein n=1 Tax=Ethanoligenens sp. TaxID=2099655 RepID=UPI0039E7D13C
MLISSKYQKPMKRGKLAAIKKIGSVFLCGCVAVGLLVYAPKNVLAAYLAPASTSLYHVIDIYHGDSVDWPSLPGGSDGLSAVYMKASEGCRYADPAVASNVQGAKSRGYQIGFYHVLDFNQDGAAQADHFYDVIHQYGYTCLPAVDVEFIDSNVAGQNSGDAIASCVRSFVTEFQKRSGIDVMVYANPDMINHYLNYASSSNKAFLAGQRLWLANYGGSYVYPETPHTSGAQSLSDVAIWSRWDMWQYTEDLIINGANGSVGNTDGDWATAGIFISTPSSISCIDSPNGGTYQDSVQISGWELARTGVSRVDFYLDNYQWAGSTNALTTRADVQNALNGAGYYLDPSKCGFSYTLNTHTLNDGQHTIIAAGIANDNTVQWDRRTFYTTGGAITTVDAPSGTTYYGNVPIGGWMLNRSGQQRADYYLDNFNWLGSNNGNFTKRMDVQSIVNANSLYSPNGVGSGFNYSIPAASLTPGQHTFWVAGIGNDNTVKWNNRTFTVASSQFALDSPTGTVTGDATVSGWALEHAGVQRVDVYLDIFTSNQKFYSTSDFFNRTDVHQIVDPTGQYPNSSNSGYALKMPAKDLSAGNHTVNAAVIGNDGTVNWLVSSFSVKK